MNKDNVTVFPCVQRVSYESRLMSEKNITNILKSVTDKESYVISWNDNQLKCVIQGYYFEVTEAKSGNKYAHICIENGFLKGDNNDSFEGLSIDNVPDNADLILCVNGEVPPSSFSKFTTASLDTDLTHIDCGELK